MDGIFCFAKTFIGISFCVAPVLTGIKGKGRGMPVRPFLRASRPTFTPLNSFKISACYKETRCFPNVEAKTYTCWSGSTPRRAGADSESRTSRRVSAKPNLQHTQKFQSDASDRIALSPAESPTTPAEIHRELLLPQDSKL